MTQLNFARGQLLTVFTELEDKHASLQALHKAEINADEEATPKIKPVRRVLAKDLLRIDVRFIPDAPCAGCGADLGDSVKTISEDVMEELEYGE